MWLKLGESFFSFLLFTLVVHITNRKNWHDSPEGGTFLVQELKMILCGFYLVSQVGAYEWQVDILSNYV